MRVLLLFLIIFSLNNAHAKASPPAPFGLGLMLGSLSAMTGKYFLSKNDAVDFGFGFAGYPGSAIYADYLWHIPGAFGSGSRFGRDSSLYFGGGAGVSFWSDDYECGRWHCERRTVKSGTGIFLRGLVGFEWYPAPSRFGLFLELGPTVLLAPAAGSGLDIGLGGRWYF